MSDNSKAQDSASAGSTPHPGLRPRSIEERRRLVAESLHVGNPGNRAKDLPEQADPRHDCQIELRVDEIRAYEHNPRRAGNARFADIKESIRASGIRNPLTVTRRPGDKHFIVEAGGNTRLVAVQTLWAETREARFEKLAVLFRPWRSESHVLTSHLVENELRGELSFWDKATGVLALKAQLEAEEGRPYSMPLLEAAMKGLGLSVNAATLTHYQFATERLRTLGVEIANLSGLDVKTLQPRLNLLRRHAKAQAALGEDDLYANVFEPVFQRTAARYRDSHSFSAAELCNDCEEALAQHLGETVADLRSTIRSTSRSAPAPEIPRLAGDSLESEPESVTPIAHGVTSRQSADSHLAPDGKRPVQSDNSPVRKSDAGAPHARLIEPVRRLAELVGIDSFVRADPAAPLGYYVDFASMPADPSAVTSMRQQVSWLLAVLAERFVTPSSECRSVGPSQIEPSLEGSDRLAHRTLPPTVPLDPAFVFRLVDTNDKAGAALWELLCRVRQSRPTHASGRTVSTVKAGSR